jgi:hypothetical protein
MSLFPTLGPGDIRAALLEAAEVMRNADASLRRSDVVDELIRKAQQNSNLSDDEAMELAVSETRAARNERASRRT